MPKKKEDETKQNKIKFLKKLTTMKSKNQIIKN